MHIVPTSRRDYYDTVMRQGIDRSLVYVREEKVIEMSIDFPRLRIGSSLSDVRAGQHLIGFCGKVYPALNLYVDEDFPDKRGRYKRDRFCYNQESVERVFDCYRECRPDRAYYLTRKHGKRRGMFDRTALRKYFTACKQRKNAFLDIFVKHSVPMFSARRHLTRSGMTWQLTLNTNLKKFDFMQVFPPYQAYQEISMFLSGVLGLTREHGKPKYKGQKMSSHVSDADLAAAKGFNRYSFRKDKKNAS